MVLSAQYSLRIWELGAPFSTGQRTPHQNKLACGSSVKSNAYKIEWCAKTSKNITQLSAQTGQVVVACCRMICLCTPEAAGFNNPCYPKWLSLSDRKLLRWQNCFQPSICPTVCFEHLNKVLKKFYVQWHKTCHRMPYRFCWSNTLRYVKWSGTQTWQHEIHCFPTNTRITRIYRIMSGNSSQKTEINDFIKSQTTQKKMSNQKVKIRVKLKSQKKVKKNPKIIKKKQKIAKSWESWVWLIPPLGVPLGLFLGLFPGLVWGDPQNQKKTKNLKKIVKKSQKRVKKKSKKSQILIFFGSFFSDSFLALFWLFFLTFFRGFCVFLILRISPNKLRISPNKTWKQTQKQTQRNTHGGISQTRIPRIWLFFDFFFIFWICWFDFFWLFFDFFWVFNLTLFFDFLTWLFFGLYFFF